MDIVRIRLNGTCLYWEEGNISLSSESQKESASFDLDLVPPDIRNDIIRQAEVFGCIRITKDRGPAELVFEMPDIVKPDQIQSITTSEEVVVESDAEEFEITDEDRESACLVLSNKVSTIKNIIKVLPQNEASKKRLAVLFEQEQLGNNRPGLLNAFESAFLAI